METWLKFLSDLCGREVLSSVGILLMLFLSDLCGREAVIFSTRLSVISKRPVRS